MTRDGIHALTTLIAAGLCCLAFWAALIYAAVAWHGQIVAWLVGS